MPSTFLNFSQNFTGTIKYEQTISQLIILRGQASSASVYIYKIFRMQRLVTKNSCPL